MQDSRYRVRIRKGRRARPFDYSRYPGFRYARTGSRARSYHWEALVDGGEVGEIRRRAAEDGFDFEAVPVEYTRSGGYRRAFIAATCGPYRCRYCNRRLDEASLKVDHIVSVALAERSPSARRLLGLMGADGVNDLPNLAPSCGRCNARKGERGGLWIARGLLGAHRAWWAANYACAALFAAGAGLLVAKALGAI